MAIKETNTIFGAIKQYHDEIIKPKIKEIVENAVEKDNEILVSLQEASDKLSEDLAKEVAIREVAEHNLNVRIDEETLARITRDIEITNYLDSEIARLTKKSEDELKEYMLMINNGYPFSGSSDEIPNKIQGYKDYFNEDDKAIRNHDNYYIIRDISLNSVISSSP